ncbi:hypothetical protein MHU86_587 [Fragilaria crotonensis]|nr:hypothetical protein MHU86_587 [Fragilaria crotonensis]
MHSTLHTCCALQNILIDMDGLVKEWNNGVPSNYEKAMLVNDDEMLGGIENIPTALQQCLVNPVGAHDDGTAEADGGGTMNPASSISYNGEQYYETEIPRPPATAVVVGR